MLAINEIEAGIIALALISVVSNIIVVQRGGDFRLTLVAIFGSVVLPVLGPVCALVYAWISLIRSRRSPQGLG